MQREPRSRGLYARVFRLDFDRSQSDVGEATEKRRVGFLDVCNLLGFERQLDGVIRVVEVWIGAKHEVGILGEQIVQNSRNLSFIRAKKDFTEMIRGFTEHFFDAIEFASKDFGNARKNKNVLNCDHGKPHTASADKPGAFRNIRHSQIPFNKRFAVIAS